MLVRQFNPPYHGLIVIYIDPTGSEWESNFTGTPMSVLETLGSSLSLWLGLGIIQLTEYLHKLIRKKIQNRNILNHNRSVIQEVKTPNT